VHGGYYGYIWRVILIDLVPSFYGLISYDSASLLEVSNSFNNHTSTPYFRDFIIMGCAFFYIDSVVVVVML